MSDAHLVVAMVAEYLSAGRYDALSDLFHYPFAIFFGETRQVLATPDAARQFFWSLLAEAGRKGPFRVVDFHSDTPDLRQVGQSTAAKFTLQSESDGAICSVGCRLYMRVDDQGLLLLEMVEIDSDCNVQLFRPRIVPLH